MQWLVENPIGSMRGPYFLLLYGIAFAVILALAFWHRQKLDSSNRETPLEVPPNPDPYKLAYLRGGVAEVLRLATLDLYQRGVIVEKKMSIFGGQGLVRDESVDIQSLPTMLKAIAEYYNEPRKPTDIFRAKLHSAFQATLDEWEHWIEKENLRYSSEIKSTHFTYMVFLVMVFGLLGVYKLSVALFTGHTNVGFLLLMMAVGSIFLILLPRLPRFTFRGRRFIEHLQAAYYCMKNPDWKTTPATMDASSNQTQTDWALPVMAMGIFGISAIQGSPYRFIHNQYAASAGVGSSCGASYVSGCGSSTGDSGSSCSGGSGCGGGGCGGCGGGCGG